MTASTRQRFAAAERRVVGDMSTDIVRGMVLAGFVIGVAVAGLVAYSATLSQLRDYGVLRALGLGARRALEQSLETAELGPDGFRDIGSGPGSTEAKDIDWLTISNREQSVVEDVARIRAHPLVPHRIPIYGYVYDVETGQLIEIPDATAAGRAS